MAVDGHARGVAVEHLQALGDVGHSNAHPSPTAALFELSAAHAHTIVFDFNNEAAIGNAAAQIRCCRPPP